MHVTKKLLESLNPCKDRFQIYLKHYSDFKGTIQEFLDLDKITYEDKIWVSKQLLTKTQAVEWACLCAESVLYLYESKYPNDPRPRLAIESARMPSENINAAYAAAYAAADAADAAADAADAASAAYAAAYAASAAYVAHAYAAADAAAYAADAAAYANVAAADADTQKQKNIDNLKIAFTF